MEQNNWIPRNLKDDDVVKLGLGIKLSLADIPAMSAGGVFSYFINTNLTMIMTPLNLAQYANPITGTCSTIAIMALSYLFSKLKIKGQPTPELTKNFAIYSSHQTRYYKMRKQIAKANNINLIQKPKKSFKINTKIQTLIPMNLKLIVNNLLTSKIIKFNFKRKKEVTSNAN